jgi:hypothetical protein
MENELSRTMQLLILNPFNIAIFPWLCQIWNTGIILVHTVLVQFSKPTSLHQPKLAPSSIPPHPPIPRKSTGNMGNHRFSHQIIGWVFHVCFFFKLNRSLQKHISIQGTTLCGVSFLPLWCMRSSNERPNMVMASSVSSVGRQVGSPTNRNRFGKRLECLCLMAGLPAQRLWRPWSSARFCKFWAPDQETKASFNAIPAAPGEPKTLVASKRKRQSKI